MEQNRAELTDWLMRQLAVTREQAEGGAGLLLQVAQERLSADDFLQVADAIPAISDLIGKAPLVELPRRGGILVWLGLRFGGLRFVGRLFGGLGGLAPLVAPFAELGLPKAIIANFAAAIVQFFHEQGEQEAKSLLERVLR